MNRVVLVLASHPDCCEVCGGKPVAISAPGQAVAQPVPCLHCKIGVRVVQIPMRSER